jgi:DNA/RNA-binding domain of Phe-tRNA-synthetase-like protein
LLVGVQQQVDHVPSSLHGGSFLARLAATIPGVSAVVALPVSQALRSIISPGAIWWTGAVVIERATALDALLAVAEAGVRSHPPADTVTVRAMYKRVGLDPTKTRPSNEALLRRILKGGALPRINAMVDVINWCSMEFQLPYGLYDRARMRGTPTLRLGADGEAYAGIRKDTVHVSGRITIADDDGPFGNPTSDSARTMVTTATTDALVVVYAPAETPGPRLARVLDRTAERLARICGGREEARWPSSPR